MMTGAPLCEQAESWPALVGVTGTRDTRENREAGTGLTRPGQCWSDWRQWSVITQPHPDDGVTMGERGWSLVTGVNASWAQWRDDTERLWVSKEQPLSRLCLILWVVSRNWLQQYHHCAVAVLGPPYYQIITQIHKIMTKYWITSKLSSQSLLFI